MPHMNAGQAVLECLAAEGVRHVFGLAGSSHLEVVDAFNDRSDMEFIGVRHEQAAAHMADAYARVTGGLGVCLVSSGPGASNLTTGIALAKLAFSPVLSLSGATNTAYEQRGAKQEIDQIALFRPITKEVLRVNRAERTTEILRHAIRIALSGQRGPVHVDLPRDLLRHKADFDFPPPQSYRPGNEPSPATDAVSKAVALLKAAKSPLIVAGGGVKWSRATSDLVALAEASGIPVVTSDGHRDVMPNNHPLFFGQMGPRGSESAKALAQKADVIFALGCRLAFTSAAYDYSYVNKEAKIIQSDIEPREIGRIYPIALGLVGDAGAIAQACLKEFKTDSAREEVKRWRAWAEEQRASFLRSRSAAITEESPRLRTPRVFAELRRVVPKDLLVTIDAGYWGARATDAFDHQTCPSLFTPLDYGCLGFSFPAALGIKCARPEAPVLSINGDGGFAMNLQEIETAVRHGLNPVVLVFNNFSWGTEKGHQKKAFNGRYMGVDIGNPRFDLLAELFGARGMRVERPAELGEAVTAAFSEDKATIIDVIVDPDDLPGSKE